MHLLIGLLSLSAFAEPMLLSELRSKLNSQSPCLLAGRQGERNNGLPDSVVFCIMGQFEKGAESCVLTGYDVARDKFTNKLKLSVSVPRACEGGGLQELLKTKYRGRTLRDHLEEQFQLEYHGSNEHLALFFDGHRDSIQKYNQRLERGSRAEKSNPQSSRDAPVPSGITEAPKFTKVKVFYASDRHATGSSDPSQAFDNDRNTTGTLHFGSAEVSIPKGHQKGMLEEASVYSFEFKNTPDRHVMILSAVASKADEFFASVREKVSSSGKKEAFVFVHGYNNTFNESIRRTAQLAYDLNFDGAPIAYTWPSGDAVWKYSVAEANAEWTLRHLQVFLEEVSRSSGAERIHLIAHSMGNRVLANALDKLNLGSNKPFHQIIMAAPDIDTDTFAQLEQKISGFAARVTIYASQYDGALNSSQKFHAYRRLGQGGENVYASRFSDTIDISGAKDSSSGMGHAYYGDNPQVLTDLALIIKRFEMPASQRPGLSQVPVSQLSYWRMQAAAEAAAGGKKPVAGKP